VAILKNIVIQAAKPGRLPRRMLGIPEESTLNPSPQEWEEKKEMTQK